MTRTKNKGKGMPPLRKGVRNHYNYAMNELKKELLVAKQRSQMSQKEFKKYVQKEWSKLSLEKKLTYCNPNIYDLSAKTLSKNQEPVVVELAQREKK